MEAKGGAKAPWYKQAEAAQDHLLATQNPKEISYKDDAGHTDEISGASIHVIEFFDLAEKALAAGPVGYGPYKDGSYGAALPAFKKRFQILCGADCNGRLHCRGRLGCPGRRRRRQQRKTLHGRELWYG